MEVLITGTNTRVMWERQPRTREVQLGVEVKMEAAAAGWTEVTPLDQLQDVQHKRRGDNTAKTLSTVFILPLWPKKTL